MLWAGSVEMIRTLSRPLDSWTARLQLGKEKVKRQKVRDQSLLSTSTWGDARALRIWVIVGSSLSTFRGTLLDLTYDSCTWLEW